MLRHAVHDMCPQMVALLAVILISAAGESRAEIIPSSRRIQWDPGVRGGIPARTIIFANVKSAPYGAKGDGVSNDASAIQNAINACPSGQAVYLPAGTYMITSRILVKSGVTVRGDGMGATLIKGGSSFTSSSLVGFEASGFDWNYSAQTARNLSGGSLKGSSNLTTSVAHGWSLGDFILIDQLEDPTGDPPITSDGSSGRCTWAGRASGSRPIGQWAKIVAVPTTTTATIDPPLYYNYTKTPQGYKVAPLIQMAGVENLTIDNSVSGAQDTTCFHFAVNCWFLNVEIKGSYRRMVDMYGGLWNTIKGCVLHDGVPATPTVGTHYGPNRAYGLFMNNAMSACLIEDNQFYALSLPISLEGGPSGNVIAYNLMTKIYYVDEEWGRNAIGCHGAHPMMNLVEGNQMDDKIDADYTWGSSSHQTYFRNKVVQPSGRAYGSFGCDIESKSRYYTFVGNVLGTIGVETIYQMAGGVNYPYMNSRSIFRLGYFSVSGNDVSSYVDPGVLQTILRHGNWDSVNRSITWDATISDRNLPASLYLAGRPTWWGTLPWPAFGPDPANPSTLLLGQIPAKIRYDGGSVPVGPALATSPSSLTFSALAGDSTPLTQTAGLSNSGTSDVLNWTRSVNAAWLSTTPASGSTPGTLSVTVNPAGLSAGSYNGLITVTAPAAGNSPQTVAVTLTVSPPPTPTLSLSPSSLTFTAEPGGPSPAAQSVSVVNSGTATALAWTQTDSAAWLSATPASGTTPGSLVVSVNSTALAEGTYNGTITVTAPGAVNTPQTLNVTLSVTPAPALTGLYNMTYPDRARLLAANWDYVARTATGASRNTEQTSGATVSYDQVAHPGVLRIPCDSGDLWADLNSTKNTLFRDLPPDWTSVKVKLAAFAPVQNYQQAGIVAYQDDDNYVQVFRTYENGNSVGYVQETGGSASTVNSVAESASSSLYMRLVRDPATQTITGSYSKDNVAWTQLGSATQILTNPRVGIVVTASPDGFPNADVAWVEVTAQTTPVVPHIALTPASLAFSAVAGGAAPAAQTLSIANSGSASALSWTQSDNATWLSVTPASGSTPGSLQASVNPGSLAAGVYNAAITVAATGADNTPQTVAVTFTVSSPAVATLSLSPSSLSFTAGVGGSMPASQTVTVANSGTASALSWTQTDSAAWLSVTPASGTTPGSLVVSANPAGLAAGTYNGTITVAAPSAGNSPRTVSVTLTVAAVPVLTGRYTMNYSTRESLLAAGWDFLAKAPTGAARNTEKTTGAVVSYDQTVHPGVLRIPCDSGDLWANLNDTKNTLFRNLPSDWTSIRLKLAAFAPVMNYQQAGIVAYQDDDNYVQVYRTYENGNQVGLVQETGGSASTIGSVPDSTTQGLYLRLVRDVDTQRITGSYSTDDVTWVSLGSVIKPLSNPRLGIVVTASPSGYPNADVVWAEVFALSGAVPRVPMPPTGLRIVP